MASHDEWVRRDASAVWHGFTQMSCYRDNAPIIVAEAQGHELVDVDGRRYLDAISSLWVNTLGHRVPELDAALSEQLGRAAHSTMLGNGSTVVVELSEALSRVVPVEGAHLLYASDGASAVEQALKIALQHWANLGVEGRCSFLALEDAYHGDTVGALSLGGGGFGAEVFDPLRFEVIRAPGYAKAGWSAEAARLVAQNADRLAAVVIEPLVQGAGGMRVADPAEVEALGRACSEAGVLLVCDEVATGFGRTGTMFASERCGLRPDLLCLGKGITGGYLPMSATVASDAVFRSFLGEDLSARTLYHGHSYGGNALAAAVALRHLELLHEWGILRHVCRASEVLGRLLAEEVVPLEQVAEVRRRGLMVGVELAAPPGCVSWGRRVCAESVRRGVLLRPLGDVVVLMPPLNVTDDEIRRMVRTLREAIAAVCTDGPQR
jgi:adenosylmethionine-8-amino-7-oxononanoate aminotransferase